jgi:hypothetical protein
MMPSTSFDPVPIKPNEFLKRSRALLFVFWAFVVLLNRHLKGWLGKISGRDLFLSKSTLFLAVGVVGCALLCSPALV